jgi:hypothetical protein
VLQETSETIKFDVFVYYSAILLNDQTVSIRSYMLRKNPTNQVSFPPHNIPEVLVVSVTYL